MFRFFRAIYYYFSGKVGSWAEAWEVNPAYIKARYEGIMSEQKGQIGELENAVAGLMSLKMEKENREVVLTQEIEKLKRLQAGALAKAKKVADSFKAKGLDEEAVKKDAEYCKCSSAFQDFGSTLKSKEDEFASLKVEMDKYDTQLNKHKVSLQSMVRELDNIKKEQHETIADVVISQQEQRVSKLLSGISDSKTGEAREHMQELRRKEKAKAAISGELAGTNARAEEDEFLEYARTSESKSEFDSLILGGGEEESAPVVGVTEKTKVPS